MRRVVILVIFLVAGCGSGLALNPSLDISQYGHNAWTVRGGFIKGIVFAIAQTRDGYLWLGGEVGLLRFDGVRAIPWQPPAGQRLPYIFRLLAARDGAIWIGAFGGLFTWSGGKLAQRPELKGQVVGSLIEDREGTIWAGAWEGGPPPMRLCAIRKNGTECYGEDGAFGKAVSSLYEDGQGSVWAGTWSGIWRCKPGPPKRYATPPMELTALTEGDDGRLIIARNSTGLMQLAGDKLAPYPIRDPIHSDRLLRDRKIDSNKLLRDRDGGLWIGTVEQGLIHVHDGRTDVFTRADGLSGDVVLCLFEDREGNVWVATTGGLDRFRELPVTTVSLKQGLSSEGDHSVLAARDGSIWVGNSSGLTRRKDGQVTKFGAASGLPDDGVQSLFQDSSGRVWAWTSRGLAYFEDGRFVTLTAVSGGRVHFMTGDDSGNLWLSEDYYLLHVVQGRLVERIPWSELGSAESAFVLLPGREPGGVWIGFFRRGLSYFRDSRLRARYTASDGLGEGAVTALKLDRDGALWAATLDGGFSRLKDGHISTLTRSNGLPCDRVHWVTEDDNGAFWLWTECGLVRVTRTELDTWVADPKHRIATTVWDAADGVRLRVHPPGQYGPRVAKATDGKIWFVTGEGLQVFDPRHLAANNVPPPVHIEQVEANGKPFQVEQGMRLPPNVRNLSIDYTGVCLAAPEKVRFKYMLEGQDPDWEEVVNDRRADYSNLRPRKYRFRVIACNNSGVWNATGDSLEFSIAPAFYQTNVFLALCTAVFLALLWAFYHYRVRRLQHEFDMRLEGRVEERTRIARELHDTLLQSFQGLMFSFQGARNLLPDRKEEAMRTLDGAIRDGDQAIAEGRNAIQGLRANPALESNLEHLLTAAGKELARSSAEEAEPPAFRVMVEGARQPLAPLLQDEVYRIAREILRNAFHHAHASLIEAEIAYDRQFFRLRIRDNGKGINRKVLEQGARQGHWGLPGVRERAKRIGARLTLWSEPGAGTEAEVTVPARIAYGKTHRRWKLLRFHKSKV